MSNTNSAVTVQKSAVLAVLASLTPKSLEFFTEYAKDAGNWSGSPLFNGNVVVTSERADRGYLTRCKTAGLMTSVCEEHPDSSNRSLLTWVYFTDLGKALALHLGLPVRGMWGDDVVIVDDVTPPPVEEVVVLREGAVETTEVREHRDARGAQFYVERHVDGVRQFGFEVDGIARLERNYLGDPLRVETRVRADVNWPSIGAVTPDEARKFAALLLRAADEVDRERAVLERALRAEAAEKAAALERAAQQAEAFREEGRAAGALLTPSEADAAALAEAEAEGTRGV